MTELEYAKVMFVAFFIVALQIRRWKGVGSSNEPASRHFLVDTVLIFEEEKGVCSDSSNRDNT